MLKHATNHIHQRYATLKQVTVKLRTDHPKSENVKVETEIKKIDQVIKNRKSRFLLNQ